MQSHQYNHFRGTYPSTLPHSRHPVVCRDAAVECPACGDVWDDESEIADQLHFCGEDAERGQYKCRVCGVTIKVTAMVVMWRYRAEVVPVEPPANSCAGFQGRVQP